MEKVERHPPFFVIPAKAGIQRRSTAHPRELAKMATMSMDPGFRRGDKREEWILRLAEVRRN